MVGNEEEYRDFDKKDSTTKRKRKTGKNMAKLKVTIATMEIWLLSRNSPAKAGIQSELHPANEASTSITLCPKPWSLHVLVGGWPTPLKNMSSSVGMMKFPKYGKIKFMFQTTNQSCSCSPAKMLIGNQHILGCKVRDNTCRNFTSHFCRACGLKENSWPMQSVSWNRNWKGHTTWISW